MNPAGHQTRQVDVLAREVRAQREQFRFIARERYGGLRRVRQAIHDQLRLISEELASDLRFGYVTASSVLTRWRDEDVRILTDMIVNHMTSTAAAIVDVPPGRPAIERRVIATATRQLQLIIVGARHWLDPVCPRSTGTPGTR